MAMKKRVRRTVAAVMVLGTVGLGIGFASPASAAGRYRDHNNVSGNGCDSRYWQDAGRAGHASITNNSNEGYCN
jgi:hypothetical protein